MLETANRTNLHIDAPALLIELVEALGHDPALISTANLQGIADRLSTVAGRSTVWGWRYLRNVLNHKIDASRALIDAMQRLGAMLDGAPVEAVQGERVTILALGHVDAGALILADSIRCANPACRVVFVPRTPNQRAHCKECARIARKLKCQVRS